MGLRERKKEQTRQRIGETARQLFAERGFDRVTVAEIAREAEVAEATLFNYFGTKEDLFYSGFEEFGAQLVEAVRERPEGTSLVAAVQAFLLARHGQFDLIAAGDTVALEQARTTARIVMSSPGLLSRERQAIADIATSLAGAIAGGAADPGVDPVPLATANALLGVHSALIAFTRRRLLADDRPTAIAADLRAHGERAFAPLEKGLAAEA